MSRTKGRMINAVKAKFGTSPEFLGLIQRHFEKAKPKGMTMGPMTVFTAPTDLLALMIPADVVKGIKSITLGYKRRS